MSLPGLRNQNASRIVKRRPNNFCYHCNENFRTKEDLKYHVDNIVKSANSHNGYSESEFPLSHQNAAGHTLRSDFFQLDQREVELIQGTRSEYSNFTLDGKECYHCGQEFENDTDMKNHPKICDRMKNARNYSGDMNGFSNYQNEIYEQGHIKVTKSQKRKKPTATKGRNKKSKMEIQPQHSTDKRGNAAEYHGIKNHESIHPSQEEPYKEDVYEEKYDSELVCTNCNQIFPDKTTLHYHRYKCNGTRLEHQGEYIEQRQEEYEHHEEQSDYHNNQEQPTQHHSEQHHDQHHSNQSSQQGSLRKEKESNESHQTRQIPSHEQRMQGHCCYHCDNIFQAHYLYFICKSTFQNNTTLNSAMYSTM